MKNKLDWFDGNWNWDVRPSRVLYEFLFSPIYRILIYENKFSITLL